MAKVNKEQQRTPKQPQYEELARLPRDMMEVTWRVALPILLFSLGGFRLDRTLGTRPWLAISGVLVSLFFASLLVWRYLKREFPDMMGNRK